MINVFSLILFELYIYALYNKYHIAFKKELQTSINIIKLLTK